MRLAMSAAPMGTWEWNINSGEIIWSDSLWQLCGLEPGSIPLCFDNFCAALHPEDRDRVLTAIWQAAERQERYCLTFRIFRADGSIRWALSHGIAVCNAAGQAEKMYGVDFDITEFKAVEMALSASRQQLQALLAANDQIRETQRKEIARDIHDQIGASLTAIHFRLEALGRQFTAVPGLTTALEQLQALIHAANRNARDLCTRLRPAVLDDLGLIPTCRWYLRDWSETTGIRAVSRFSTLKQPLPDPLCTDIFRILQELLTNIGRHARATRVQVSLLHTPRRLTLRVSDNGIGITENAQNNRAFGLLGIRERTRRHGGQTSLTTGPTGTSWCIFFPWPTVTS